MTGEVTGMGQSAGTERVYKKHLNGLKGMACCFVMLFHYFNTYQSAQWFPVSSRVLDAVIGSRVAFLCWASFWLYLFFVISGYLLAGTRITRLWDVAVKSVGRFLRLALPIFFAALIIYVLFRAFGFHTQEIEPLFSNNWIGKFYTSDYPFVRYLRAPIDVLILGISSVNRPYWPLREMLIASVVIYALIYIKAMLGERKGIFALVLFAALLVSYHFSDVVFTCLWGAALAWLEEGALTRSQLFPVLVIAMALIAYVEGSFMLEVLFFSALTVFVPRSRLLNGFFSSRSMSFLGDISFGVYSFHWPVYCSVGLSVLLRLGNETNLLAVFAMAAGISVCMTIILAYLYHISLEKLSGTAVKKLTALLQKL